MLVHLIKARIKDSSVRQRKNDSMNQTKIIRHNTNLYFITDDMYAGFIRILNTSPVLFLKQKETVPAYHITDHYITPPSSRRKSC